jgi:Zn-finger protein
MFKKTKFEKDLRQKGKKEIQHVWSCMGCWWKSGKDAVYLNIIYDTAPMEFAANEDYSVQQEMMRF